LMVTTGLLPACRSTNTTPASSKAASPLVPRQLFLPVATIIFAG